jgi:hypothetical protein
MAMIHLFGSMAFVKNNISPNTAKLNPRVFNKKGNANSAPNVMTRFFQFISWNEKRGFSFSLVFFKLEKTRFNKEQIASKKAARKGTKPDPGSPRLPREALIEEVSMIPATSNKKMLLIWSFRSFIINDTRFKN